MHFPLKWVQKILCLEADPGTENLAYGMLGPGAENQCDTELL